MDKRLQYLQLEGNKKPLEISPVVRKGFLVLLGENSKGKLKWKSIPNEEFDYPIFCNQEKIETELVKQIRKIFPEESDRPILLVYFEGYQKWIRDRVIENKLAFEY